MSATPAYTMSGLCAVGGVIGFLRTGSLPSIIAGVAVGGLYGFSAVSIAKGDLNGHIAAFAASLLLLASSLPRVLKGPIPALLTITSAASGVYYGLSLRDLGFF